MIVPTKEQVDTAITAVIDFAEFKQQETSEELEKHTHVIAFSLRALRMLMDDPSYGMARAFVLAHGDGYEPVYQEIRRGYIAMRDKLLEQAGEEK